MLLVSYLSTMVFALLSAFSTSYIMFVIMRFFTGMSVAGISIVSVVLSKYTDTEKSADHYNKGKKIACYDSYFQKFVLTFFRC